MLDCRNLDSLELLYCFKNSITGLNLSNSKKLNRLIATNNNLNCLNVQNGNNKWMRIFSIWNNTGLKRVQVDDTTEAKGNSWHVQGTFKLVQNSPERVDKITTCDSYKWVDGKTYTSSSKTATVNLKKIDGCDSSVRLDLTIIKSSRSTLKPEVCYSYTSPSGKIWRTSGTYLDTIPNQANCDSIITINLTVNPSTKSNVKETVCNSYTSPSGKTWTSSGIYLDTIPNYHNCDSIITVDLTVGTFTTSKIQPTACNSYTSPSGKVWTNTGTYLDTIPNQVNCDSIITIDLTVNKVDTDVSTSWKGLASNQGFGTYQWLDCGNNYQQVAGATSQIFTPKVNGDYAVWVTASNGCTDTSACYTFSTVGMEELAFPVLVSPNPTQRKVHLSFGKSISGTMVVRNTLGQLLSSTMITNAKKVDLNLKGETGIYFIEIQTEDKQSKIIKVVKE